MVRLKSRLDGAYVRLSAYKCRLLGDPRPGTTTDTNADEKKEEKKT